MSGWKEGVMPDMPHRFPATLMDCLVDFLTLLKEFPCEWSSIAEEVA